MKASKMLRPVDVSTPQHIISYMAGALVSVVDIHQDSEMSSYFSALEKLSDSLQAVKTIHEDLGIDEISSQTKIQRLPADFMRLWIEVEKLYGKIFLEMRLGSPYTSEALEQHSLFAELDADFNISVEADEWGTFSVYRIDMK